MGSLAVRLVSLSLLLGFIVGCGKDGSSVPKAIEPGPIKKPVSRQVEDTLQYSLESQEGLRTAKIFLIAGGANNANFAQEIVDQKIIWMKAGFKESDIACYYTVPLDAEFQEDRKQYESLSNDLSKCFPASPEILWRDL